MPSTPSAVSHYVQSVLDGEDGDIGLLQIANDLKADLREIEDQFRSPELDTATQGSLHQRRRTLTGKLDKISDDIACLQRLTNDSEMQAVFDWLNDQPVGNDDEFAPSPAALFVHAAYAARASYQTLGEATKKAADLQAKIATQAARLAHLLRDLESLSVRPPPELLSTRSLLCGPDTDTETDIDNLADEAQECDLDWDEPALAAGDDLAIDRLAGFLSGLPAPHELLERMAEAAQQQSDRDVESMTDAALQSRQRQIKTDYLRAFMHALTTNGNFTDSVALRNAVAITATVALEDPDTVVTLDDVTKATR